MYLDPLHPPGNFAKHVWVFQTAVLPVINEKSILSPSRNVGEAAESTKQFITHQVIMAVL